MRFVGGFGRLAAMALGSLGLAGPLAAQDDFRMLDGSLTYRERMALPADALAVIEARDARGRLLGEATFATRGAQVPLPFALGIPEGFDADLRAAIVVEGQPMWFTVDVPVSAGTEPVSLGEIVLRRFVPMRLASTLRCGQRELRVGFHGPNAVIDIDGERRVLERVSTASGVRYEAPEDPGTWVWSRRNRALVSIDGEELPECAIVPPEAPKPYIARGHGPDWMLTVDEGLMSLVVAGSEARAVEAALPKSGFDEGAFVYEVPALDLELRVAPRLCRDDQAGMPYPESVTIRLGDRRLTGCGGETLDALAGAEWMVEDLDGGGIIDSSRVTVVFGTDGTLSGQASCNRYATPFEIADDGISVGPIAASRMMCPEAVMDQERRFFAALTAVERLELDETGALLLYDPARAEPAITARR